ncbi:hypothetical protein SAMD00019534_047360 [Acytostelium subglobosum LB1]|uniref:hypothetical protein n=1 Tax=Acytostelium subglobosum LB1 TaxID=1410327 RepID=UPI000644A0D9|nr:hypothetical protein SAMD00019534_047360 [Acytostelium subglobosum LB1]GAM21561.1 hypothetical protein SAMD00019534_047360 [Acytostelium subglobosum LB1]|eukprot:XP_012755680.1 hypothetical protein SAMD00019534_047360 [Acytostelium subglobosum LB1]
MVVIPCLVANQGAPSISSITPPYAPFNVDTTITIQGSGFIPPSIVTVGGVRCQPQSLSTTRIICALQSTSTPGVKTLTVSAAPFGSTSTQYIQYTMPTIQLLTPSTVVRVDPPLLTIKGNNFYSGLSTVTIGTKDCPVISTTSTQIICATQDASADGIKPVFVSNDVINSNQVGLLFLEPTPVLYSLQPTSIPFNIDSVITLIGTNFTKTPISVVNINGVDCPIIDGTVNRTYLECTAQAVSAPGTQNVQVVNVKQYKSALLPLTFKMPTPSITSITPNSGLIYNRLNTLSISGTGFVNPNSTVTVAGQFCSMTFVNYTLITCDLPPQITTGPKLVVVNNPTTPSSNQVTVTFVAPTPVINNISPMPIIYTVATNLTITGLNFIPGMSILMSGTNTFPAILVMPNTIIFAAPTRTSQGTTNIVVLNQGVSSNTFALNYIPPTPTVTSVTPSSLDYTKTNNITIIGTNFVSIALTSVKSSLSGWSCSVTTMTATSIICVAPTQSASTTMTLIIYNENKNSNSAVTLSYVPPTPTITNINPPVMLLNQNSRITMTGTKYMTGITTVKINGQDCTAVQVVSTTQVSCQPPIFTTSGTKPVIVYNENQASNEMPFNYVVPVPTIVSVTPNTVIFNEVTKVVVTGNNFVSGVTQVMVDGRVAAVTGYTSSQLFVNVPALTTTGIKQLYVMNEMIKSSNLNITYVAPTPTITSIYPPSVTFTHMTQLTINGTGYASGMSYVTVDGINCTDVYVVSANRITCYSPVLKTSGSKTVMVINEDKTGSMQETYVAPVPSLTSVQPLSTTFNAPAKLTLTGWEFVGSTQVTVGAALCPISFQNYTTIICQPAASSTTGAKDVAITTEGWSANVLQVTFAPPTPVLTSVYPSRLTYTTTTIVTMSGSGFVPGMSYVQMSNNINCTVNLVTASSIQFVAPIFSHSGTENVTVVNEGVRSNAMFVVYSPPVPAITAISPSTPVINQDFVLQVNGTNFSNGMSTVRIDTTLCPTISVTSTSIRCTASAVSTTGSRAVTVTNDGTVSNTLSINFIPPTPNITSLTPWSVIYFSPSSVTINGANFVTNMSVAMVGAFSCPTTIVNSTTLIFTPPIATIPFQQQVTVLNQNVSSNSVYLSYVPPQPSISSVQPDVVLIDQPTLITVYGANFMAGTGSRVLIGGVYATYVSGTSSSLIVQSPVVSTSFGNRSVSVSNDYLWSNVWMIKYIPAAPVITSITPATAIVTQSSQMTLTGTGFYNWLTVVTVGAMNFTITSINSTNIMFTAPMRSYSGAQTIWVANDVYKSNNVSFEYVPPTPSITSISPTVATFTETTTLEIDGSGFINGMSQVRINGTYCPTTSVSPTVIWCNAPPMSSTGVRLVIVSNEYITSNSKAISYIAPVPAINSLNPSVIMFNDPAPVLTVAGSGFVSGMSLVLVGGIVCPITQFVNSTMMVCLAPVRSSSATLNVTVTNEATMSNAQPLNYIPPLAGITSITPLSVVFSEPAQVTLVGFAFVPGVSTVVIGGMAAPVLASNSTWMVVQTPMIPSLGPKMVLLYNEYMSSNSVDLVYIAPTPSITSITPTTAVFTESTSITLTGTNFFGWLSAVTNGATNYTIVSITNTTIVFTAPSVQSALGNQDLYVINDVKASNHVSFAYIDPSPIINTISPSTVLINTSTSITLTGSGFVQGLTVVFIGSQSCGNITVISSSMLTCVAPSLSVPQQVSVTAINGATMSIATQLTYVYPTPTLTSVSPTSVIYSQSVEVTIIGTNFYSNITSLRLGSTNTAITIPITSLTDTQLIATIPAVNASGSATLTVSNGDQTSNGLKFDHIAPVPGCVAPNGDRVSWWFARKLPFSQSYMYLSSSSSSFDLEASISNSSSCLGRTLMQLEQNAQYSQTGFFMYNDRPWYDDLSGTQSKSINGKNNVHNTLGKGFASFRLDTNQSAGFHIVHTLEGFPVPLTGDLALYKTPASHPDSWFPNDYHLRVKQDQDLSFGHSFLCHSFANASELIASVQATYPFIYKTNLQPIPSAFATLATLLSDPSPNANSLTSVPSGGSGVILSAGYQSDVWTPLGVPLSITLPAKSVIIPNTYAITEQRLTTDFATTHDVPIGLRQWRSDIDRSRIGFKDSLLCLGAFNTKSVAGGGLVACVPGVPSAGSLMLKEMAFRYMSDNCTSGACNQTKVIAPTTISGRVILDTTPRNVPHQRLLKSTTTPGGSPTSTSGFDVTPYQEALVNPWFVNTTLYVADPGCTGPFCDTTPGAMTIQTDALGLFTYTGNWNNASIKLQLHDTHTDLKIVDTDGKPIEYEMAQVNGTFHPLYTSDSDANLLLLFKTVQEVLAAASQESYIGVPAVAEPMPAMTIVADMNSHIASIVNNNNDPNAYSLDFRRLCVELAVRTAVLGFVDANMPQAANVAVPVSAQLEQIVENEQVAMKGAYINMLSMALRDTVFPTLPKSEASVIIGIDANTATTSRTDIEHFTSTRTQQRNGPKSEGWITAYLWDLIDEDDDDCQEEYCQRTAYTDGNSDNTVDLSTISTVVRENGFTDVLTFTNNLIAKLAASNETSPLTTQGIKEIMIYNHIYNCSERCVDLLPAALTNSSSLEAVLLSLGICQSTINSSSTNMTATEVMASLWVSSTSTPTDWTHNQAIQYLFSTQFKELFINTPLLQSLLRLDDPNLCEFLMEDGYPITPRGIQLITKVLNNALVTATLVNKYNQHSTYFVQDQASTAQDGLAIVTYQGQLCAITKTNLTVFQHGADILALCPSGPIVSSITGLSGPTVSTTNVITVAGWKLSEPGVQVIVGQDPSSRTCQTQSVVDQSDGSQVLTCVVGSGVGIVPITYSNTLSNLPQETPLLDYQFVYDAPVIQSVTTSTWPLPTIGGGRVTIAGHNFVSSTTSESDILVSVDDTLFSVDRAYQYSSNEYLIISPSGTGYNKVIAVEVAGQSTLTPGAQQHSLNFTTPVITSVSLTRSATVGGDIMTVYGSSFGLAGEDNNEVIQVNIGDTPCSISERIDDNTATCVVPPAAGISRVGISVDKQSFTDGPEFKYDPPIIFQVIQEPFNTSAGGSFWIIGQDLGPKGLLVFNASIGLPINNFTTDVVCFEEVDCYYNKTYVDDDGGLIPTPTDPYHEVDEDGVAIFDPYVLMNTSYRETVDFDCIVCRMLPGIGKSISVNGSVSQQSSNVSSDALTFQPPTVLSISKSSGSSNTSSTDGGDQVTITGYNFAPNELLGNDTNTARYEGSLEYSNVTLGQHLLNNITFTNSTLITGAIPAGIGANITYMVYIGGQTNQTNMLSFNMSYMPPNITSLASGNMSTDGGRLTVYGTNFIPANANITINSTTSYMLINGTQCANISWTSSGNLSCTVAPGIGANMTIDLSVGTQHSLHNDSDITFSYAPPNITTVPQAPTDGDATITMIGTNFVPNAVDPGTRSNVSIANTLCPDVQWISSTQVACRPRAGIGKNLTLDIVIGGQRPQTSSLFSYLAPSVSNVSSCGTPGGQITFTGTNFVPQGVSPADSNVTIGDSTTAATTQWIDSKSLVSQAPAGIGKNITITLIVGNQTTDRDNVTYSYTAPTITSAPKSSTDGDTITIQGTNFVPSGVDPGSNSNVTINNSSCTSVSWIDDTHVSCKAPAGIGKDLSMAVVVGDQANTDDITFTYKAPAVSKVTKSDTKGTSITLSGYNFVPNNVEAKDSSVKIKDDEVDATWKDSNTIVAQAPKGIGKDISIKLVVGDQATERDNVTYSYNAPKVSSVPKSATDGEVITIVGTNFVPSGVDADDSSLTINGDSCDSVSWIDDTHVSCSIAPGIGRDLSLSLVVGDQENTDDNTFSYNAPTISSVSDSDTKGSSITLTGTNFVPAGVSPADSNITINNQDCETIDWISSTQITCTAPSGVGADVDLVVFIGNQSVSSTIKYSKPVVDSNSYSAPTKGDKWITITGDNFVPADWADEVNQAGSDSSNNTVSIGDNECDEITWSDYNQVLCKVPKGTGANKNVQVTVGTQSSDSNDYFSYDAPSVSSISPEKGRMSRNTLVTITGKNFGDSPSVKIGSGDCSGVSVIPGSGDDERLTCSTPTSSEEGDVDVQVEVDGQQSSDSVSFEYYGAPKIDSISPSSGSIDGRFSITISGKNLEEDDNEPSVNFNVDDVSVDSHSSDQIVFTAPSGGGQNIPLFVTLGDQISDINTDFSYDGPSIDSISPSEGNKDNPTQIMISGSNLGLSDESPEIDVGGEECSNIIVYSSSSVGCTVEPSEEEGEKTVTLTFYFQTATGTFKHEEEDSSSSDSSDSSDSSNSDSNSDSNSNSQDSNSHEDSNNYGRW